MDSEGRPGHARAREAQLVRHVVHHDVHDHVHASRVRRLCERPEIVEGPHALIEQREVLLRITMVIVVTVLEDWRDPDAAAAQCVDVVEPSEHTSEVASVSPCHIPDVIVVE